jgi:hypothetical protein
LGRRLHLRPLSVPSLSFPSPQHPACLRRRSRQFRHPARQPRTSRSFVPVRIGLSADAQGAGRNYNQRGGNSAVCLCDAEPCLTREACNASFHVSGCRPVKGPSLRLSSSQARNTPARTLDAGEGISLAGLSRLQVSTARLGHETQSKPSRRWLTSTPRALWSRRHTMGSSSLP